MIAESLVRVERGGRRAGEQEETEEEAAATSAEEEGENNCCLAIDSDNNHELDCTIGVLEENGKRRKSKKKKRIERGEGERRNSVKREFYQLVTNPILSLQTQTQTQAQTPSGPMQIDSATMTTTTAAAVATTELRFPNNSSKLPQAEILARVDTNDNNNAAVGTQTNGDFTGSNNNNDNTGQQQTNPPNNHNNNLPMACDFSETSNKQQQQPMVLDGSGMFLNSNRGITGDNERRYRPQKFCAVCGDKAIACNFNAVTCESCKAFFRRNAFKEQRLKCLFDNRCLIDKVTRRFCSKCRLLKCFQIGMKREWILTDEQKQIKKVKILQNKRSKQLNGSVESKSINSLPPESSTSNSDDSSNNQVDKQEVRSTGTSFRDASTSCPDEEELLEPSRKTIHHCSMASHCHYCALRLGCVGNTQSADYMTNYANKNPAPPNQHQYNSYPISHQQQQQQQQQQSHSMANYQHHQGLPPYNAVLAPSQLHSLGSCQTGTPASGSMQQPVPLPANCCFLNDDLNQNGTHNQMTHFNHHHTGGLAQTNPTLVNQQQQQQLQTMGPSGLLGKPEAVGMIPGGEQLVIDHQLNPHHLTGNYNYAQQYNHSTNINPFVVALEVRPLYTTVQQAEQQKQPLPAGSLMAGSSAPADSLQPGEGSCLSVDSNLGSPQVSIKSKSSISVQSPSQIEMIISNAKLYADAEPAPCYEMSSSPPFYQPPDHIDPGGIEPVPVAVAVPVPPAPPTRPSSNQTSPGNGLPEDDSEANSEFIVWNEELYYEPANTELEVRNRVENLDFNEHEQLTINEIIEATRFIFENANSQDNHKPQNSLNEIVYFCDAALRRLIKTVKQIKAFRMLSMDDQIILLKTACFKILILRSTYHYHTVIDGWIDTKTGNIMRLDFLKRAKKSLVYERHRDLVKKFPEPLRKDRLIMAIMSLALLFDPSIDLKHSNSVKLDNLLYLSILRKYLVKTQPDPLTKFESLTSVLQVINACNEEYNVFFSKDFQPEQITPLLIEIFDISIEHNSIE